MKRTLIVAAIAALSAAGAFAQSSVNIYGRFNTSVERQKDGSASTTAMVNNASRIGFKGVEDLGGGLKAGFLLEHGFNADTGGTSGAFWGRESNVYVEGGFGKVRLGNMGPTAAYFATADYISMHNHDTGTSSDAFYLYPGDVRNTVAYTSPALGGLQLELQYGLKEATKLDTTVVAVNYDAGPLHLGGGYVDGPVTIPGSALTLDGKEWGVRGLIELGAVTLGTYYTFNEGKATGLKLERSTYRLSAMYALGASEFHANIGAASKVKAQGKNLSNTDAKQFTLGYNYNLSKRTKVYGFYTKVDNGKAASYYSSAAGRDFSSIAVGLRHNF